ncbi:MAG: AAA family ATPase, partial [Microcystaceae cyanobacterium]
AALINAEEWLLQADYSSKYSRGKKQKELEKQINDITAIFKRALPDVADISIFLKERKPFLEEIEASRPQLRFLMPYGWIPFADMGLGYKTMMTWILDLVIRLYKRYPNSADPLAEPAIVLVDEIDLHLHPKWQRTIMSFLTERFPNTQFIVTAHSPLVVQASQDANIVLLRRDGDRVIIDNDPDIIDNWRIDQILTTLFEIPSARSPQLDPLFKRREEILSKPQLTPEDKAELKELAQQIGSLPTGENAQDIEAMDIIRRAAKLLEQKTKS